MERALRVGDPIALTKVTEELDPSLRPILLRDTFTRGGHEIITLGETEIEYNNNFRLLLYTETCETRSMVRCEIQRHNIRREIRSGVSLQ